MLIIIRPAHRFLAKYDVKHHHVLIVWSLLSIAIPVIAIIAALGATFSSFAQALSLAVMGISIGVFFYILLEAEESRLDNEKKMKEKNNE